MLKSPQEAREMQNVFSMPINTKRGSCREGRLWSSNLGVPAPHSLMRLPPVTDEDMEWAPPGGELCGPSPKRRFVTSEDSDRLRRFEGAEFGPRPPP